MVSSDTLTYVFWYGSIVLEALLVLRIAVGRFWRRYPRFSAFILALGIESLALAVVRPHGAALYGQVWVVSRVVALTLEALAVFEIFSLWVANFRGIESFGRKLFVGLVSGGLIAVFATLPLDLHRGGWALGYQLMSVLNRVTHLFLAVCLAMMLVFFSFFGAPVALNLRRHAGVTLIFLATTATAYLQVTVAHEFVWSNLLLPAVSFLCLAGWLVAFRQGQDVRVQMVLTPAELAEYRATEVLNGKLQRWSDRITLRGMLGLR
ncbi:MAG TPA: hypothetical protein VKB79_14230 [Bryobacteraceae bacterium]|nr:hypothetical protein [Bryobacteraceae bacterium]